MHKIEQISSSEMEQVNVKPFEVAAREFIGYVHFYRQLLESLNVNNPDRLSSEQLKNTFHEVICSRLAQMSGRPLDNKLSNIFSESVLIQDLAEMVSFFSAYMLDPEKIEKESKIITLSGGEKKIKYVSQDVDRLLLKIRNLGLIPFETLDLLKDTKFSVIGASVAAETITLLASLGAENITFYDDGFLERSNQSRMPSGSASSIASLGDSKAETLMSDLQNAHPYAAGIRGIHGRVLLSEVDRNAAGDVLLQDIVDDTDIFIEVADSGYFKAGFRREMKDKYPEKPVVFMADVGNKPFAGMEDGSKLPFNQPLSESEEWFLRKLTKTGGVMPQALRELTAIKLLVRDGILSDHMLQALVAESGVVPYFSQTPIASRLSAALSVSLIIEHFQTGEGIGKNIDPSSLPTSLIGKIDGLEVEALFNELITRTIASEQ